MNRATIFISDLHLNQTIPKTTELFINFAGKIISLAEKTTLQIDGLYILGDLFQFWGGDDDRSPFNEQIKSVLKKISDKIPVYLMVGNRDFLLGKTYAAESGCTLISDPYKIDLYGKPTLLTHGDILCTNDIKYRIFKSIIRIPYGIKFFLQLPLNIRLWLARNVQKYSSRIKSLTKIILIPNLIAIKNLLTKFSADQIIHGHIHIEESEEITLDDRKAIRISLSEWADKESVLIYYNDNSFEFGNLFIKN